MHRPYYLPETVLGCHKGTGGWFSWMMAIPTREDPACSVGMAFWGTLAVCATRVKVCSQHFFHILSFWSPCFWGPPIDTEETTQSGNNVGKRKYLCKAEDRGEWSWPGKPQLHKTHLFLIEERRCAGTISNALMHGLEERVCAAYCPKINSCCTSATK